MTRLATLTFVLVLLAASNAVAAEVKTEIDPAVQTLADKQWAKPPRGNPAEIVRPKLSPLKSDRMKKLLPEWSLYRAEVFNPVSVIAGRPTFIHALAIKDGKHAYLENDASAAQFLSDQKAKPADSGEALDLVLAFAELRGYALQVPPRTDDAELWKLIIEENKDAWVVQCTFVTDPNISLCCRYTVTVGRDGSLTTAAGKVVLSGGYD